MFHVPDWLAERNVESWRQMLLFYDDFLTHPGWEFVAGLRRLVTSALDTDLARSFRAGQSLYRLMVSTATRYGLELGDPFVGVDVRRPEQLFSLTYYGPDYQIVEERTCEESEVVGALTDLLTRLGNDPNAMPARVRDPGPG